MFGLGFLPRLPRWLKLSLILLALVAAGGIGYWGFNNHPQVKPLSGPAAEKRMAAVFGEPRDSSDGSVVGDILIERFYGVDTKSREHYVWDMVKGRVKQVQLATRKDLTGSYTLLIDRNGMSSDRARLEAFVKQSAPAASGQGRYLGLVVQPGSVDGFQLNYDGSLPKAYSEFQVRGKDLPRFLDTLSYDLVSGGAYFVNVRGTNFLVSNTQLFPQVREWFKVENVVFLSRLLLVDDTSASQVEAYQKIWESVPPGQ